MRGYVTLMFKSRLPIPCRPQRIRLDLQAASARERHGPHRSDGRRIDDCKIGLSRARPWHPNEGNL